MSRLAALQAGAACAYHLKTQRPSHGRVRRGEGVPSVRVAGRGRGERELLVDVDGLGVVGGVDDVVAELGALALCSPHRGAVRFVVPVDHDRQQCVGQLQTGRAEVAEEEPTLVAVRRHDEHGVARVELVKRPDVAEEAARETHPGGPRMPGDDHHVTIAHLERVGEVRHRLELVEGEAEEHDLRASGGVRADPPQGGSHAAVAAEAVDRHGEGGHGGEFDGRRLGGGRRLRRPDGGRGGGGSRHGRSRVRALGAVGEKPTPKYSTFLTIVQRLAFCV